MTWTLTSPVTGAAQTGFTSPTYTVTADASPDVNGKQFAVTALGGTQTNVRTHAASDPFTVSFFRPKSIKTLQSPNPITGKYGTVGFNDYVAIVRKGVNFAANQAPLVAVSRFSFSIPAGSDAYDSANVRALVSCAVGAASQQSVGIGDTCVTGILG